jgi:hypothetical protein
MQSAAIHMERQALPMFMAGINSMDRFIHSRARNQLITAELETCDESLLR